MLYNPKTNPVVKALYDAADLIDQHGLVKCYRGNLDRGFCLHGAISQVLYGSPYYAHGRTDEEKAVGTYLLGRGEKGIFIETDGRIGLGIWNNQSNRTKQEVVDALRGAAEMVTVGA